MRCLRIGHPEQPLVYPGKTPLTQVRPSNYLRDVLFYILSLLLVGLYSFIGFISLPMSIAFLLIYVLYVLLIGLNECRQVRAESASESLQDDHILS